MYTRILKHLAIDQGCYIKLNLNSGNCMCGILKSADSQSIVLTKANDKHELYDIEYHPDEVRSYELINSEDYDKSTENNKNT